MYKVVIGLEIHTELDTKSKMFSPGEINKDKPINECVSAVDIALPGVLPVVNKEGVRRGIKLAAAMNCEIPEYLYFDRKNYYYPDLPKGYQITQQHSPIGINGYLNTLVNDEVKKVLIHDIHIEEDTANLEHTSKGTLIDYNRAGIPLIEIVTEPCMSSYEEVSSFLDTLRLTLVHLGISKADASKGEMRCDVNISLMKENDKELGVRTEVKNVSSLTGIKESIEFEIKRHTEALDKGEKLVRETRRYVEATHSTVPMRKKEEDVDYKYFVDPNIPKIKIDPKFKEDAIKTNVELPFDRLMRYISLGLLPKDAKTIIHDKDICDYFESCLSLGIDAKNACNYLVMNILGYLNKNYKRIDEIYLTAEYLKEINDLVTDKKISSNQAKELIAKICEEDISPKELVKKLGMEQISDEGEIIKLVNEVLDENMNLVETYKSGKTNILGALVGKTLQKSGGKANPSIVNKVLNIEINKR